MGVTFGINIEYVLKDLNHVLGQNSVNHHTTDKLPFAKQTKPGFLHCSSLQNQIAKKEKCGFYRGDGALNTHEQLSQPAQSKHTDEGRDLTNASHVRPHFPSEHDDSMYATRT